MNGYISNENHMMIKVNVMYPYTEGARFDHAYYRDRHMPMVKSRLGSACAYYTIEKGLAGGEPEDARAPFVAMCAFICGSADGYQAAMQEHGARKSMAISPTTPTSCRCSRSARSSSSSRIVERGRDVPGADMLSRLRRPKRSVHS